MKHKIISGMAVAAILLSGVAVSVVAPTSVAATGPGSCYEQVHQERYTRTSTITELGYTRQVPKFKTQEKIEKEVKGNFTHAGSTVTTPFDWADWPDAGPVWDDGRARSGPHSGTFTRQHDGHTDTYRATEYRYVVVDTRQVPDGFTTETQWSASNPGGSWTATGQSRSVPGATQDSGWRTTPPSGDGWVLVERRTIDGQQVPCNEMPPPGVETRSTDGTCQPGDDVVTIEHFSTPYTFVLDGNFEWAKVLVEEVQLESTTRTLTAAEQVDCMPVRENNVVTVDGTFECNDATVEQRTTTTSFTYDYAGGVWIESSTVAVTSSRRPLADDERTVCPTTTTTTPNGGTTTTVSATTTVPGPTTTNPVAGDGGTVPPRPDETTTSAAPGPTTTNPVAGDGGTVPPRTPTGGLPSTGGSGSSGILQLGALLLLAGFAVFVVARRRDSTEPA